MDSFDRIRLNELIVASIDNDISFEQFDELKECLRDNPQAQDYYSKIINLFVVLKENRAVLSENKVDDEISQFFQEIINDGLAVPAIRDEMILESSSLEDIEGQSSQSRHRELNRKSLVSNLYKFAAIMVIFFSIYIVDYWLRNKETVDSSGYLGHLSRVVDAQWDNVSGPIDPESKLYAGPMSLKKGLAEIILSNGAEVIIKGPCEFKLESDYQIYLDSGSLVANIENTLEKRLVVRTDNATVVDYGTEFGVSVDYSGNTTTQVFQGCVELRQGSDPFKYDKSLRLEKDQGGQVNPYGNVYNVQSNYWEFVRKEQFDVEVKAAGGSAYHQWKAYSYQLQSRHDLVAYYTFEKDGTGMLSNMAGLTRGKYQGELGSLQDNGRMPEWVEGRWPGKTALKFNANAQQYVVVEADEQLNISGEVTLAAWIKIDQKNGGGHILSNRIEQGAVNYQLAYNVSSYNNKIQFLRYAQGRERVIPGDSVISLKEWHLLAISHDNMQIKFYVDGELQEVRDYKFKTSPVIADLFIGSDLTDVDMFQGVIGEIAIFNNVLNDAELAEMYKIGRP